MMLCRESHNDISKNMNDCSTSTSSNFGESDIPESVESSQVMTCPKKTSPTESENTMVNTEDTNTISEVYSPDSDKVRSKSLPASIPKKVLKKIVDSKNCEPNGVPKIVLYVTGDGPEKKYRCSTSGDEEVTPKNRNGSDISDENIKKPLTRSLRLKKTRSNRSPSPNSNSSDEVPIAKKNSLKPKNTKTPKSDSNSSSSDEQSNPCSTITSNNKTDVENNSSIREVSQVTAKSDVTEHNTQPTSSNTEVPSSKIVLDSSRHLGKPTAHVEPYGLEPLLRSRSRKGRGFYDETIPLLVDQDDPVNMKEDKNGNISHLTSTEQCYPETENNENSQSLNKQHLNVSPRQSSPTDNWEDTSDSAVRVGRSKLEKYLQSLKFCGRRRTKDHTIQHLNSNSCSDQKSVERSFSISKRYLRRSSSLDSFFSKIPDQYNLKSSKSVSDFTAKLTDKSVESRLCGVLRYHSTDVNMSHVDQSDPDDEVDSLCIDETNSLEHHNKVKSKWKRKKITCYDASSNELDKFDPKRKKKDKKKEQIEEGNIVDPIERERQVLHEREKGKRLAQEIPRFNWLEEKIRSSDSVPTRIDDPSESRELHPIQARRSSFPPEGHKSTSKPIPALIPRSQFSTLVKDSSALCGGPNVVSSSAYYSNRPHLSERLSYELPSTSRHTEKYSISDDSKSLKTRDLEDQCHSPSIQKLKSSQQSLVESPTIEIAMGSLKRHLQAAVPPLTHSNKGTVLPKQRLKSPSSAQMSPPISSSQFEDDTQINSNKSPTFSSNIQERDATENEANVERGEPSFTETEKMAIFTNAFKERFSNCMQDADCGSPNTNSSKEEVSENFLQSQDKDSPQTHLENAHKKNIPQTSSEETLKRDESAREQTSKTSENPAECSKSEERSDCNEAQILLKKIKNGDIGTPAFMTIVLEELIKMRQEVEKIGLMQEKILNEDRFRSERLSTCGSCVKQESLDKRPVIIDLEKLDDSKTRNCFKYYCQDDSNYYRHETQKTGEKRNCQTSSPDNLSKRPRVSNSPVCSDPNTITIRYTLPSKHDKDIITNTRADITKSSHLRNYLGIFNNDLHVVKVDNNRKESDDTRAVSSSDRQERSVDSDKTKYQGAELMKLLENPSTKYQRPNLPDLPNLIPSNDCNSPYSHAERSHESQKQPSQVSEHKVCQIKSNHPHSYVPEDPKKCTVISVPEPRPLSAQNPNSIIKESHNPHSDNAPRNPIYVDNPRKMSAHYVAQEDSKYMSTKMTPRPQTFQPRILIHSQDKEAVRSSPEWNNYPHPPKQNTPNYSKTYLESSHEYTTVRTSNQRPWNGPPPKVPMNPKCQPRPVALKAQNPVPHIYPTMGTNRPYSCVPHNYSSGSYNQPPGLPSGSNANHLPSKNHNQPMYVQVSKAPHQNKAPPYSRSQEFSRSPQAIPSNMRSNDGSRVILSAHSPSNSSNSPVNYEKYACRPVSSQPYKVSMELVDSNPANKQVTRHKPTGESVAQMISSHKCSICVQLAQFVCSGCKLAWYCSRDCQKEHWGTHSSKCLNRRD